MLFISTTMFAVPRCPLKIPKKVPKLVANIYIQAGNVCIPAIDCRVALLELLGVASQETSVEKQEVRMLWF